jgi:hypothetical protein
VTAGGTDAYAGLDPSRTAASASVFEDDPRVEVRGGDWHRLHADGPFDLLVLDDGATVPPASSSGRRRTVRGNTDAAGKDEVLTGPPWEERSCARRPGSQGRGSQRTADSDRR